MKATGIVRRIDDLGRVVIPKEIRRTQRIREGDPLEIFTTANGEVIFKKYSPMGEMANFAAQYTQLLYKQLGHPALICDQETVLAATGPGCKFYLEKRIGLPVEKIMNSRQMYCHHGDGQESLYPCEGANKSILVGCPILAGGDVGGAVLLLTEDRQAQPDQISQALVQLAAGFLAKQLED